MTPLHDWIELGIAIALAFAGSLIAWGRIRQKVKSHDEDIEKALSMAKAARRSLFREDGTLIYVTVEQCGRTHTDCQGIMAKNLEEIKAMVSLQSSKMEEVQRFMGRVEEYMRIKNGKDP